MPSSSAQPDSSALRSGQSAAAPLVGLPQAPSMPSPPTPASHIHAPAQAPTPRASATLSGQLAGRFAERIRSRTLAAGARLPSVRACAQAEAVSPSTVVQAYDQLQAMGLIEARHHRGFFVRGTGARDATPQGPAGSPGELTAPVDAAALARGMFLQHRPGPAQGPGLGTLPDTWLDGALVLRALRRALPEAADALRYGDPAGDPGLRAALSRRLSDDLGIAAGPEQIVTTVGATHALDLIVRHSLRPGDAVLVDDPGWAMEIARLRRLGLQLLPVPRGPDGPDLNVMAELAQRHRPRLYSTVSVLHNPTGHSLSLAHAHRLLQLAEAHDLTIIEDDTYAWFAPPHAPRLSALDGLRRTVYVSGFSKILAPNWRVGHLAASPALARELTDLKLLSTLTTPSLTERAVAWCLEQGLMRRHADRVMQRLAAARQRVVRLAEAHDCRFVAPPDGLFGWLDTGVDTDRLAVRMAAEGWLLAPGALFTVAAGGASRLMRVNFATTQEARFWQSLVRHRQALREADATSDAGWLPSAAC